MHKNFSAGILQETDKKYFYLSEEFLSCSVLGENDVITEMKWIALKCSQGEKRKANHAVS